MKIGVITFWDSQDNYGQLLQCFALQHYLKGKGHEVYLIRYKATSSRKTIFLYLKHYFKSLNMTHIFSFIKYRKDLKLQLKFQKAHPRYFDEFKAKYISSTEKCYAGYRELWTEDWTSFDVLITGSDQVWSYSNEENLNAYFLNWGQYNLKRIAYATSFGRKALPLDYDRKLPVLLSNMDFVGLREQSGVELCQHKGRTDARLVCDPTLLLSGDDYLTKIVGNKETEQKNSLFCYLLNWETLFPYEELKAFLRGKGLEMKFVPAHGVETRDFFESMEDLSIPSWLIHLKSAKYVVTNSFHGTVFCILFHKLFMTLPLLGQSAGMNERIVTLLTELGLTHRIYSEGKNCEKLLAQPIDWDKVDELLKRFRKGSADFLENALQAPLKKCKDTPYTICFQTNGGVNHRYGGLDRVTELLADYFEARGNRVYYLSFTRREGTSNERQYYFPNSKDFLSRANIRYYNKFLTEKRVDILINQEGNVNIHLPYTLENEKVAYLTVLHFEPNYIKDYYFEHRISQMSLSLCVRKMLTYLVCRTKINGILINHLRNKLKRNYHYQVVNCDRFILLSDRFKKDLSSFFPHRIPLNVFAINNPSTFSPYEIYDSSLLSSKENVVVYVGRLENYQKKIDSLLRIWRKVSARHTDWKLKIVGDGSDKEALQRQAAENDIRNISFEGQQNPVSYYKEASVFCLTSGHEGWGMVLVEAQSFGCVPMAFNSYSSVQDIIQDGMNGIVIPAFDEALYAEKLEWLMTNAEVRNKMALTGMKTAQRFSIDNIGETWLRMIASTKFSKQ